MIERRRMARPQGPSITDPSESGPRWTRVSFIAARAAGSGGVAPSRLTRPHIPHMRASLESALDQTWEVGSVDGSLDPDRSGSRGLGRERGPTLAFGFRSWRHHGEQDRRADRTGLR